MLLSLRIKSFAIIDSLEVDFQDGFTVVTGETGAGKSILVGALGLALGGRASTDVIRDGAPAAEVEALFDITSQPVVRARLGQRDLVGDDPQTLVVRRVVQRKGRGKVLVNGSLATVATLSEIVRGLVDISGQHDQQSLLIEENHLEILDAFGRHDALRAEYQEGFRLWQQAQRELQDLRASMEEQLQRADFLRFGLEEIETLAASPGEIEELEQESARLLHAERLKTGAVSCESLVYGEDGSAFDRLGRAAGQLETLAAIDPELKDAVDVLDAARNEVQEVSRKLQTYAERVEVDPERLEQVEDRLAALKRACRKYGGTIEAMLARAAEQRAELGNLESADERMAELEAREAKNLEAVLRAGRTLSKARKKAATSLRRKVAAELGEMDLKGAQLDARVQARSTQSSAHCAAMHGLGPAGLDEVELWWNANPGEDPKPLIKIASGGELSRVMLAVKRILSARDLVSLYVFDEVDTGLGGRAADRIGRKIKLVAKDHQAITITHLAPIAVHADHHLSVTKKTKARRRVSHVESLDGSARAAEVARMIDGSEGSRTTTKAAKEMLARAQKP